MTVKIVGISGSPVRQSNTDRIVKHILGSSNKRSEFYKLSSLNIKPCFACKRCVEDNICKVKDDFPPIAEKLKNADAFVVGSYCPYGSVDGFTKAFLERMWSLRHVNNLMKNKKVVTVVTGLAPEITKSVSRMISTEMLMERMNIVGQIEITGNVPCLSCGRGDDCEMSAVPLLFGEGKKVSDDLFGAVEDQTEAWKKAEELGKKL